MRSPILLGILLALALTAGIVAAFPMLLTVLPGQPSIGPDSGSPLGVAAHRLGLPQGASNRQDIEWNDRDGTQPAWLKYRFSTPGTAETVRGHFRNACRGNGLGPAQSLQAAAIPGALCEGRMPGAGDILLSVTPTCADRRCDVEIWLM